jgi:hypothetical protein
MILEPGDCPSSCGDEPPPSDVVDKKTWHGITVLLDDAGIRTSSHHGGLLKTPYHVWRAWAESVGEDKDPLRNYAPRR